MPNVFLIETPSTFQSRPYYCRDRLLGAKGPSNFLEGFQLPVDDRENKVPFSRRTNLRERTSTAPVERYNVSGPCIKELLRLQSLIRYLGERALS